MSRVLRIDGTIDPHVHMRDLDWAYKATFYSETCAAAAGGYTAVFDMPNTPPTTTHRQALEQKLNALRRSAVVDWGIYAGASQHNNCDQFQELSRSTCGLKIYNNATTGDLLIEDQNLRDEIYRTWPGKTIAVHAEEDTVLEILELVRKYRKPTHFVHISTAREIHALQAAKEERLPISIGVCPHHLYLTEEDEKHLGGFGLMKPVLKKSSDRDALWRAIQSGIVDVIESDHAPHTIEEKKSDRPPYGVPGLETNLPLLFSAVHAGRLTVDQAVALVSTNAHRIWGVPYQPDTYTLIDIDERYIIGDEGFLTQCGWSPFNGMQVYGRVRETWIRGRKVYEHGQGILVEAGYGINLFAEDRN